MTVAYEWVIEELDMPADSEDEFEILSVFHEKTYELAVKSAKACELPHFRIGLVRDVLDDHGCMKDRAWAYVADGQIGDWVLDAYDNEVTRTPMKYRREVSAHHSQ